MKEALLVAKALAEESRLRVLLCLEGSTLCLCHLTEILGLAASTVSKHLGVLSDAGLLVYRQEGRWRYYRWPDDVATPCVRRALAWVREFASGDPLARNDAARRAVVLQTSTVPCPQDARARVLFLCTGNSCRSQMAEGLLRAYAGKHFEVYSAGLDPRPIADLTVAVMDEIGIDISMQKPKSVVPFLGRMHFGYLITVCANAESSCPIFPGVAARLYWPIEDPAQVAGPRTARLAAFRMARDDIGRRIHAWLIEQGVTPAPLASAEGDASRNKRTTA
jgi:arsenate reductase